MDFKNIFFILFALVSQVAVAQPIFNFGPELGINISQLPEKNDYTSATDNVQSKTMPLFGPLAGIHAQLVVRKLVLFTSGLQYEIAGTRYTFHNVGTDTKNMNLPFTADISEKKTFQKLCLPLSVGVTFPLLKLHISVYGGWRGNYFINGRYYKKTAVAYPTKPEYDYTDITDINPLDKNECQENIKPFNNQMYFGLSVSKGRFEFALNHYSGMNLTFSADPNIGSVDYNNNDNTFSVRYRFFGFGKQSKECNLFE